MNLTEYSDFEGRKQNIYSITAKKFKRRLKCHHLDDDKFWKVTLIKDMIELRREKSVVRNFSPQSDTLTRLEIEQIISEVCTS